MKIATKFLFGISLFGLLGIGNAALAAICHSGEATRYDRTNTYYWGSAYCQCTDFLGQVVVAGSYSISRTPTVFNGPGSWSPEEMNGYLNTTFGAWAGEPHIHLALISDPQARRNANLRWIIRTFNHRVYLQGRDAGYDWQNVSSRAVREGIQSWSDAFDPGHFDERGLLFSTGLRYDEFRLVCSLE